MSKLLNIHGHIYPFEANLDIIGINPFVQVPIEILELLFLHAEKSKGPIPIKGTINHLPYAQTLVKYKGVWRLYINQKMLKNSPSRIGEKLKLTVAFDKSDRSLSLHPKLEYALSQNKNAQSVYNNLSHSKKQEIIRYISSLKTSSSVDKNVLRAIKFLNGETRFLGRDKP